jgi:hypothetical protein
VARLQVVKENRLERFGDGTIDPGRSWHKGDVIRVEDDGFAWGAEEQFDHLFVDLPGARTDWLHLLDEVHDKADDDSFVVKRRRYFLDLKNLLQGHRDHLDRLRPHLTDRDSAHSAMSKATGALQRARDQVTLNREISAAQKAGGDLIAAQAKCVSEGPVVVTGDPTWVKDRGERYRNRFLGRDASGVTKGQTA